MPKGRNRAVVSVLLLVFFFFIILMLFASYTMNIFKDQNSSFSEARNYKSEIAVIEINGPIMTSKKTIDLLLQAEKNKNFKAIILRINSPGGAVGPSQEIYEEVRRIDGEYSKFLLKKDNKKTNNNSKPIYASFGSIAASGGYYIGSATRRIYANAGTLTGSIGVVMNLMNLSKLYEWVRISPTPIKAGKYKDAGSPHRSLTKEEKKLFDDLLTVSHKQFVSDILAVRKDRIKGNIWDMAQGQVFNGSTAKELGLVDNIASLWTAGREIHKELKLSSDFSLNFIKTKKKTSLWKILENFEETITNLNIKAFLNQVPMFMYSSSSFGQ